ncbi:hypothetical protein O5626_28790, partial [Escherichia coli]|nr:hypothetical protein [Escherichia coli]
MNQYLNQQGTGLTPAEMHAVMWYVRQEYKNPALSGFH